MRCPCRYFLPTSASIMTFLFWNSITMSEPPKRKKPNSAPFSSLAPTSGVRLTEETKPTPTGSTATSPTSGESMTINPRSWSTWYVSPTAVAPAPPGASAHANDEPVASGSSERGATCKKKLWRELGREQLEAFRLAPWASRRREDLLQLLDRLNPTIAELTQAIEREAEKSPQARRLMTHPGVGSLTALAFVLIIGKAERFQCGKQIAAYLGLVPLEESSGERRRLGHITKQGNSLLRFLLVEAAQATTRTIPEWRSKYIHLTMRRGRKIAKVAMARKLAMRLFWMMRQGWNYQQVMKFGSQGRKTRLSH